MTPDARLPLLADFASNCEDFDIPAGAARLDAFLALPVEQQDRIWSEIGEEILRGQTVRQAWVSFRVTARSLRKALLRSIAQ